MSETIFKVGSRVRSNYYSSGRIGTIISLGPSHNDYVNIKFDNGKEDGWAKLEYAKLELYVPDDMS